MPDNKAAKGHPQRYGHLLDFLQIPWSVAAHEIKVEGGNRRTLQRCRRVTHENNFEVAVVKCLGDLRQDRLRVHAANIVNP